MDGIGSVLSLCISFAFFTPLVLVFLVLTVSFGRDSVPSPAATDAALARMCAFKFMSGFMMYGSGLLLIVH